MHISLHTKSATEASIIIKIEEADYQPHVENKIKEYSKKATIKGFRPGNVPLLLIKQMYGQLILMEELNALLADTLRKYLKENELSVLGEPIPEFDKTGELDWEHQRNFEFAYAIGMAGPFTCTLSKDIKVTEYKVSSVTEQTVDELIAQLRKTYGRLNLVEKSQVGDILHGALYYPEQNFKAQIKIELAAAAGKRFTDLRPHEKIVLNVQEVSKEGLNLLEAPAKVHEAMLKSGGQAEFTIEQIYRTVPAVLDQEFFDKVLGKDGAKSEKDLQEKLQERIIQSKQQEAASFLEQAIQAKLLQQTAIALPEDFLKRLLQQKNNTVSQEQIETYYAQYAQELQWSLIIEKLIQEHNLQVTHQEVAGEAKQRFQYALSSNEGLEQLPEAIMAKLIQNFLQEEEGKNYKQIYENLIVHKVYKFVKGQITVDVQEVSVETFDKRASK